MRHILFMLLVAFAPAHVWAQDAETSAESEENGEEGECSFADVIKCVLCSSSSPFL